MAGMGTMSKGEKVGACGRSWGTLDPSGIPRRRRRAERGVKAVPVWPAPVAGRPGPGSPPCARGCSPLPAPTGTCVPCPHGPSRPRDTPCSPPALTYGHQLDVLALEELESHGHVLQLHLAEIGARMELAVHALLAEHLEQRDEAQPVAEVALQVGEALAHALEVLVAPARERVLLDLLPRRVLRQVLLRGRHVVRLVPQAEARGLRVTAVVHHPGRSRAGLGAARSAGRGLGCG